MSDFAAELANFVPAFIREHLAQDSPPAAKYHAEPVEGALMFADISGFSKLANLLAQRGPEGAEQLNQMLNLFYGRLVKTIYAHGGDVIGFAGDAAIALWVDPADCPRELLLRVCDVALRLQQELHHFDVGEGIRLSMKIGIGFGQQFRCFLGSPHSGWIPFVGGAIFEQIQACTPHMNPGEIILSAPVASEIAGGAELEFLSEGTARVVRLHQKVDHPLHVPGNIGAVSRERLLSFVPANVTAGLQASLGDWLADLRRITVVFATFPNLAIDRLEDMEIYNKIVCVIQQVLRRFAGYLVHFIEDDKGVVAVMGFGLAPSLHEDAADRAVRAALEIQQQLQDIQISSQIGISTGRVFSGVRGGAERREFCMTGAVVNLAARLMSCHQADLLCDVSTAKALRRHACVPLAPIQLKGYDEPLLTFRPAGERLEQLRHQEEISGRGEERRQIDNWLAQVAGGQSQQLFLQGQAGIGKSMLMGELQSQATQRGIRLLKAEFQSIEQNSPYRAWRQLLSQLLGLNSNDYHEIREQRVRQALATDPESWAEVHLLNHLLGLNFPKPETETQLSSRALAENLQRLVLRMIQKAARGAPLLLIIEDVHWLDSASWRLFDAVVKSKNKVSLAMSLRPIAEPAPETERILAAAGTTHVSLAGLPDEDLRQLLRHGLHTKNISPRLFSLVRERSQGNPFYAKELIEYLREANLVTMFAKQCDLAESLTETKIVPDSIRDLVTARVDRLPLEQQVTLKTASVIGFTFASRVLVAIGKRHAPAAQIHHHLQYITQATLIELARQLPDLIYQFQHAIIQEVTYDQITSRIRRQIHGEVAQWLEEQDQADDKPRLLAFHFGRAGLPAKEIHYLDLAGEAALAAYANQEAVSALREVLQRHEEMFPQAPPEEMKKRAHWRRILGEALYRTGNLGAAEEQLHFALRLMQRPLPQSNFGVVVSIVKQLITQTLHRITPGLVRKETVLSQQEEKAAGPYEATLAVYRLGQISYLRCQVLRGLNRALLLLNSSERIGKSRILAMSYAAVSLTAGVLGRYGLAHTYARLAEETCREVGHQPTLSHLLMALSITFLGNGEWEKTGAWLAESKEIAERVGDQHHLYEARSVDGIRCCLMADYSRANENFAQIEEAARRSNNELQTAVGVSGMGECLLRWGKLEEADAALSEAYELLKNGDYKSERLRVIGLGALTRWRMNNPAGAARYQQMAAEELQGSSLKTVSMFEGFASLASIALDQAAADTRKLKQAEAACLQVKQYAKGFPIGWSRYNLTQGSILAIKRKAPAALKQWRKALQFAEKYVLPLEQGTAHLFLGSHGQGEEAVSHLRQAVQILNDIGACHELELARAALG